LGLIVLFIYLFKGANIFLLKKEEANDKFIFGHHCGAQKVKGKFFWAKKLKF
jgi:hypothetical protein